MRHAHATEWLSGRNEPGEVGRAWAPGRRPGAPACLAPWLSSELFHYAPTVRGRAALRLVGSLLEGDAGHVTDPALVVRTQLARTEHPAFASVVEERADSGLLWVVSFDLPLEVVRARRAIFTLAAVGRLPVALPSPLLDLSAAFEFDEVDTSVFTARRARRYLLAVGAGVAVATSGATASAAAAAAPATAIKAPAKASAKATRAGARTPNALAPAKSTTVSGTSGAKTRRHGHRSTTAGTHSTAQAKSKTLAPVVAHAHHTASLGTAIKITRKLALPKSSTVCRPVRPFTAESETVKAGRRHGEKAGQKSGATATPVSSDALNPPRHHWARRCDPATPPNQDNTSTTTQRPKHDTSRPKHHRHNWVVDHHRVVDHPSGAEHAKGVEHPSRLEHPSGGAALRAKHLLKPRVVKQRLAPGSVPTTSAPVPSTSPLTIWDGGFNVNPFTAEQLKRFSSLVANPSQPPKFLMPIYRAAGRRFHIPWQILAAINAIETNYGQDLAVSPAGAIGWMQFMPGTWREFGMAADGNQVPNPFDPQDAIFSAARYLAANGGAKDIRRALFAYNHALWYVDAVLWRAQLITDYALGKRAGETGYALPLDLRYMLELGRIDDGVDIEDAPDGAAVYSMTPGIITAVASDPTGFGPDYPVVMVTKGPLTGQYIYYGHVAASLVHVGQHVLAGQPIAVMGHTGDAASLGHGHIEIGFSDASGDPLNHHGLGGSAWTPSGDAMRHVLRALTRAFLLAAADARLAHPHARDPRTWVHRPTPIVNLQGLRPYGVALALLSASESTHA